MQDLPRGVTFFEFDSCVALAGLGACSPEKKILNGVVWCDFGVYFDKILTSIYSKIIHVLYKNNDKL